MRTFSALLFVMFALSANAADGTTCVNGPFP